MDKYWRVTEDEYKSWLRNFEKTNTMSVNDWADWSLKPQPLREIFFRTIRFVHDPRETNCICLAYVVAHTQMPAEALKDLAYVTSNAFSFDTWTDECVDAFVDIMCKGAFNEKYDSYEDFKKLSEADTYKSIKIMGKRMMAKAWDEVDKGIRASIDQFRKYAEPYKSDASAYIRTLEKLEDNPNDKKLKEYLQDKKVAVLNDYEKFVDMLNKSYIKIYETTKAHIYLTERIDWEGAFRNQKDFPRDCIWMIKEDRR